MHHKKHRLILLIAAIIILVLTSFCSFYIGKSYRSAIDNTALESKCYTTVAPSLYLSNNAQSPLIENAAQHYIQIQFPDNNFFYSQVMPTGSMSPTIPGYANVIMITPSEKDLNVGDIIDYNCKNQYKEYMLHRVVEIKNINNTNVYIAKGDNNPVDDCVGFGCCNSTINDITGKVVGVIY